MNKRYLIGLITGTLMAASPVTTKPIKKADIVAEISTSPAVRTIAYNDREIETIRTKLGYSTVISLPKSEVIMDIAIGDKPSWIVNGAPGSNLAYVKPKKAGSRTNLNIAASSGNVYSFLLSEGDSPDLKVFVDTSKDEAAEDRIAPPKWVLASELEAAKQKVEDANEQAAAARMDAVKTKEESEAKAATEISAFKSDFPSSLKHDYVYKEKRWAGVHAIAHNDKWTYIWADPAETPALYEVKDKKPSLINFEYRNNVFVVPKVLDSGYLIVGKHKMEFKRED